MCYELFHKKPPNFGTKVDEQFAIIANGATPYPN